MVVIVSVLSDLCVSNSPIYMIQIKREISIMKIVRHPYVVRLYEACDVIFSDLGCFLSLFSFFLQVHAKACLTVFMTSLTGPIYHFLVKCYFQVLASRTKIYIILEFVTGGELFDKIVSISDNPVLCGLLPLL